MRVFIIGIDGYLGWALAQHLAHIGFAVGGLDALLRREWVREVGGESAIPIAGIHERRRAFERHFGYELPFWQGDILDYDFLQRCLADFAPDVIVHLGEMPSAPYSMIDQAHAAFTQQNNVIGSLNLLWAMRAVCPDAHLVKLGTMGEYGTPNIDIPEGFFEVEYRGRCDTLPFPRQAGSFYHWSKVHDSNNIMFACRVWGLRATDIMQGVVYGTRIDAMSEDPALRTRLDFDECFGTIINRFCCQAVIGHPLTIYGQGRQQRGFLPLRDVMQCLTLTIASPPDSGQYRVFNQFDRWYELVTLAETVQQTAKSMGLKTHIEHLENPRIEMAEHHYVPDRNHLPGLGYIPTADLKAEIGQMLADLLPQRERIRAFESVLRPSIHWDGTRKSVRTLNSHGSLRERT